MGALKPAPSNPAQYDPSVSRTPPPGCSPAYAETYYHIVRFAQHDRIPLLFVGETGAGKEYHARLAHRLSPRWGAPVVTLSLAALEEGIAGSDLFGHERGAFTSAHGRRAGYIESAIGGTLFLDELGKTSRSIQHRLLRVVEDGQVIRLGGTRPIIADARFFFAAREDLDELVERGEFSEDLLARIGTFTIRIPPLRECRDDIVRLVTAHVVARAPVLGYDKTPRLSEELLYMLIEADWPHNVRQLLHTMDRLLVDAEGASVLEPRHLAPVKGMQSATLGRQPLSRELAERLMAVYQTQGKVAEALGCSRKTVNVALQRPFKEDRDCAPEAAMPLPAPTSQPASAATVKQ